jgi:hypothetical protein
MRTKKQKMDTILVKNHKTGEIERVALSDLRFPGVSETGKVIEPKNVGAVKRILGRVVMGLQKGWVNNDDARTMAYVCRTIVDVMRVADVETRLAVLEESLHITSVVDHNRSPGRTPLKFIGTQSGDLKKEN